jgi:predicted nuclease of restriction endonuclease-like (RecB) superfamily
VSNRLLAPVPENYATVFAAVEADVRSARTRAVLAANAELIVLYLSIGRRLSEEASGWGERAVDRLADDLRRSFPEMKGFSRSNLFNMRRVWLAWKDAPNSVQQLVGQIPWGHHLLLVTRIADPDARVFYLRSIIEHGWSRAILGLQVDSRLHERAGRAVTNFQRTLPPDGSDLAEKTLKDPYIFDFLTTGREAHEREVEAQLVEHIERFLLELGAGFAFVGRQYHLEVGDSDYYIDLLFFHLKLRCFVVVELKARPFEPADVGQINFYLSAVDDRLRHPSDAPTIGLLLCKGKDRVTAEYALRGLNRPIGVADWETQLVERLPDDLRGSLPTVEELERELAEPAKQGEGEE